MLNIIYIHGCLQDRCSAILILHRDFRLKSFLAAVYGQDEMGVFLLQETSPDLAAPGQLILIRVQLFGQVKESFDL